MNDATTARPLLEVKGLSIGFATDAGRVTAVDRLDLTLAQGRTLAIVGESGCGKSATALAVLGLLAENAEVSGTLRLAGQVLTPQAQRAARGRDLAMIFQEPMTSLNPAFTAGEQVAEALRLHEGLNARDAMDRAIAMLERVRIPEATRRAKQYPHQLSGGMRQRVMIAIALACKPKLLIADEPTTALDVTVQAQILALLDELKRETGTAVVLITHDLGVVRDHADEVVVMYAGRVVEAAPVEALFDRQRHPYTMGLLACIPSSRHVHGAERPRLTPIPGSVPSVLALPPGCAFAPRCPHAVERCAQDPPLLEAAPGHLSRCWRHAEL
jgi:peptide/nickel transport system ATP-binding protein